MSQSERLVELMNRIGQLDKEIQEEIRRPERNAVLVADLRIERSRYDLLAQHERDRLDRAILRMIRLEHQKVHVQPNQAQLAPKEQTSLTRRQPCRVQARALQAGRGTSTFITRLVLYYPVQANDF
jgi:hypothetical protein